MPLRYDFLSRERELKALDEATLEDVRKWFDRWVDRWSAINRKGKPKAETPRG